MRANIVSNPNLMANGYMRATRSIPRGGSVRGAVIVTGRKRNAARRRRNPSVAMRANAPVVLMANPRRRRRNAAPLIMPMANPRRRRRRNGGFNFNLQNMMNTALVGGLSAGGAYLLNKMFISGLLATGESATTAPTLGGVAMRGAARLVAGALGLAVLPPNYGAAFMAANMYPIMREIDNYMHGTTATTAGPAGDYEADISQALGY